MHITAVMAMSANGRTTRGKEANVEHWTSPEDKKHFADSLAAAAVLIMGAATYEVHRSIQAPSTDKLRVILTPTPEKYQAEQVPNSREFYNMPPVDLVKMLEERGFTECLLLGGAATSKGFFEAGLVNELVITLEPRLFGNGRPLIEEGEFEAELKLVSCEQLNNNGSLLLRYEAKY